MAISRITFLQGVNGVDVGYSDLLQNNNTLSKSARTVTATIYRNHYSIRWNIMNIQGTVPR